MKIYGISASPRHLTTEYALNKALDLLNDEGFETKLFSVSGKQITPCMHCDYCMENKKCVIQDDMLLFMMICLMLMELFLQVLFKVVVSAVI